LSRLFTGEAYKLIIIGTHIAKNQGYVDRLHQLINELELNEHVEFRGHITGENKEIAYAESFALILPSESENFGNVAIEAMNHGTPVIASTGTPWSILEEYKAGYHIDNSPESIAGTLDEMISLQAEYYLQMRKNAINLVRDKFDAKS